MGQGERKHAEADEDPTFGVARRAHACSVTAEPCAESCAQQRIHAMATGTVKFFNAEKGFGFISREGASDVFVHFSNIEGSGYKSLNEGDTVEFEVAPGKKGEEAQKVRVI